MSLTNGASFTTDNVVKTLNALVVAARASLDVRPARHTSAGARKHKHPATRSVGSREKTIVTVLLALFVVLLLSLISSLFTGSAVFCSEPTQMDGNCPPIHCTVLDQKLLPRKGLIDVCTSAAMTPLHLINAFSNKETNFWQTTTALQL